MSEAYDHFMERNTKAFKLFFEIEVLLREIITVALKEKYGNKWLKQGLPLDVREKVKAGTTYERATLWSKLVPHSPLYYVDFPDLKRLIEMGTNWPIFAEIWKKKDGMVSTLGELEAIRNKIAHSRYVTDEELKILESAKIKLINPIHSDRLNIAKGNVSLILPITDALSNILDLYKVNIKIMEQGGRITPINSKIRDYFAEWWFDECYFGVSVECTEKFYSICLEYSEIPSGIGQGLKRLDWVMQRNALSTGLLACIEIEKALRITM
ncbi:hypothetical protein RMS29_001610 [Agrobacterium rosae]|uniref:Swt1-like HEPN domain-containing protein n=1 Tax=Agrobacterium rosae TaxID=1972867 RepID=A0ABU4VVU3_9HYPH|nr:hypothetical protein [Agrobacterium rosae]MDX8329617.1 hypothetical protein [Agrobacterium rosae]